MDRWAVTWPLPDVFDELTQTTFGTEGNCWQTCVAAILRVDPATLPQQKEYDRCAIVDGKRVYEEPHRYYRDALGAYLKKHHGLAYVELALGARTISSILQPRSPGIHMMTGKSPREGSHVVIARYGEIVWDPHPSRAGLVDDDQRCWAFLVPYPPSWERFASKQACECPACATEPAR